jgi:hypothetical protein
VSQKAGKTNTTGQLKGLAERKTPEQLAYRAAKTEVRAQISLEHAKTRGVAMQAFNNTLILHARQKLTWGGLGLLTVLEALSWLWR